MNQSKKVLLYISILLVSGFFLFNAPAVKAVTPALSLVNNSNNDTVQVIVNGDPNVSVIFYYTQAGVGSEATSIGVTNSSGYLSASISTSTYQIASGSAVHVTTNGFNGPASNSVIWPVSANSNANTVSLSPAGVVLTIGQSVMVTASGASSFYLLNNSNPPVANVNISGSQITILANSQGSAIATICAVGSTTNCTGEYVLSQTTGAGLLSFSQNNISISPSQSVPVVVSGGNGQFVITNNSNPSIIQASMNGQVLTLTTNSTSGSSSMVICTTDNGSCGVVNATASVANTTNITFSQSNPSVVVGQTTTVTIYGASGSYFYVSSNSNPNIVQANIINSTLTLVGNAAGSSTISICASASSCASLTVTVINSSNNGTITLSQNIVYLAVGQTLTVTVSGGVAPYSVYTSSSSSGIVQASLSGNTITLYGVNSGSAAIDVCPSLGSGNCTSLTANVGAGNSGTNQPIFSQNNLSLIVGQGTVVNISGAGGYYIATNTNLSVASVSISGSSAVVSALALGTTNVSICQNGGQCTVLFITVSNAATVTPTPTPTPAATTYVFPRYLGYGDKGDDVLQLQEVLVQQGFLSATPNGHYGPATFAAVKKFQAAHGINQTGNVGPSTKNVLNQTSSSTTTSTTNTATQQQILAIQQAIQQLLAQIAQMQGH